MIRTVTLTGILWLAVSATTGALRGQSAPAVPQARSAEAPCRADTAILSSSIDAHEGLRPVLQTMLRRSATFRRQCRRLAEYPLLLVRAEGDVRLNTNTIRAQAVIDRTPSRLLARVTIGTRGIPYEWVAHEFEHLIEQIDGVRMGDDRDGMWRSGLDSYETERAILAGRTVLGEIYGDTDLAAADE